MANMAKIHRKCRDDRKFDFAHFCSWARGEHSGRLLVAGGAPWGLLGRARRLLGGCSSLLVVSRGHHQVGFGAVLVQIPEYRASPTGGDGGRSGGRRDDASRLRIVFYAVSHCFQRFLKVFSWAMTFCARADVPIPRLCRRGVAKSLAEPHNS